MADGNLHKAAKILGHKGGQRGGPARAKKLPAKRRQEIAHEGGLARQHGSKKKKKG